MKDNEEQATWFTVQEAAAYLRVTRKTLYNYMDQGLLPYYELKVGRGRRFKRTDLDNLLERRVGSTSEGSVGAKGGSKGSKESR